MTELCKLRDVQRAMVQYETAFESKYGICINAGMALCSLSSHDVLTSGELGELLGLSHSNTSKVICALQKKGYIRRDIGKKDKRKMIFTLTKEGEALLDSIDCDSVGIPKILTGLIQ
jgi:DNA-binding MarR family transcriptional regulator